MLTVIPKFKANTERIEDEEITEVIRLFQRTDFSFQLLILDTVPNLNLVLHRFNLSRSRVWNVWDEIQDVYGYNGLPVSFDDLELPPGRTISYRWPSVFFDDANNNHRQQTIFHPRGFVTQTKEFLAESTIFSQYDYRGFKSYTDWFDADSNLIKREWYTASGDLVMTQQDDQVHIAPNHEKRFEKQMYENPEEIVYEFLQKYLARYSKNIILSQRHVFIREKLEPLDKIDRVYYLSGYRELADDSVDFELREKDYYVLPTKVDREMFYERMKSLEENKGVLIDKRLRIIPLFPTELDIGISNDLTLMNIYWHWGDYPTQDAVQLMARLLGYMNERDDLKIQAEVADGVDVDELNDVWEQMVAAMYELDLDDEVYQDIKLMMIAERERQFAPFDEKKTKKLQEDERFDEITMALETVFRFDALNSQSRNEQNGLVTTARVYLDTGQLPDLRLQTASISAGIPQITQRSRGMLKEGLTGMIATSQEEIMKALHYYLDNLRPWNEALVENVQLLEQYQEAHIIQEWEELVDG